MCRWDSKGSTASYTGFSNGCNVTLLSLLSRWYVRHMARYYRMVGKIKFLHINMKIFFIGINGLVQISYPYGKGSKICPVLLFTLIVDSLRRLQKNFSQFSGALSMLFYYKIVFQLLGPILSIFNHNYLQLHSKYMT